MKEVISILVAIMSALLTFYLANRLTLNDSMDSKSGWRKELMDIASKDEITLADIYRIRASVRYYPHLKPTQLSFRWMTNLIIKLCDEYFVEVYKYKKAGTNNGGQNIIIIQSAINSSRQFRRRLTNSTVAVSPENDEIVRIICRYLLKYHWEARQKMRIFRRGRDLMNIDDDEPSEDVAQTIQLILEQVKKMSRKNCTNSDVDKIINVLENSLCETNKHKNELNFFKTVINAIIFLCFATLILAIAYKIFTINIFKIGDFTNIWSDSEGIVNFLVSIGFIIVVLLAIIIGIFVVYAIMQIIVALSKRIF
ncbi:hypothetical protein [Ligilactobacillus agilis]|uniref:hypothetical protein n=1 Tax=Ligilactobacillus agilis TaxID=1601 RepID=UPI00254A8596|nr:hypothetical protein [Ligilactobacillus agilis]MDK6809461.1 hypothetical protein [Ligilactobacillus agilis]